MRTIIISIILVLGFKCSGQLLYTSNISAQNSEIPKINLLHTDKVIDFNEKDSIVYTLNFRPDSVSKIEENKNFIIMEPHHSSTVSTVNNITKIQSTYSYIFTPVTTKNFKFPSLIFYLNGQKYTTDYVEIKVIDRQLTKEELRSLNNYNLTNTLNKDTNTMQIVFNGEMGYISARKNGKFVLVKELSKNQIEKINKIIE